MILAEDITTSSQYFNSLRQNIKEGKYILKTNNMRPVFRKDREELAAITLSMQLLIR